jgi:hypothetical protein
MSQDFRDLIPDEVLRQAIANCHHNGDITAVKPVVDIIVSAGSNVGDGMTSVLQVK